MDQNGTDWDGNKIWKMILFRSRESFSEFYCTTWLWSSKTIYFDDCEPPVFKIHLYLI